MERPFDTGGCFGNNNYINVDYTKQIKQVF